MIKKGWISRSLDSQHWIFKYADSKSALPEEEALPLVKGPFGYLLADGHHHILASMSVGATWVPVRVIADLSHFSEEEFWKEAERKGWAYLYKIDGEKSLPPRFFEDLTDDPNRYFTAITARKCKEGGDLSESKGAEYPLWVKVGKDIPFIEFKIADVLWKNGIIYHYEMGDSPPEELIEKARSVLLKAQIQGLRVIPQRTHYSQIQLSDFEYTETT